MEIIRKLLTSRKFVASLVGVFVATLGVFGLNLDEQQLLAILTPIIAYILGQGLADFGKEKK